MATANLLEKYVERFGNLNVDLNKKRYTTGKAPHKGILLLSLITLHQCGRTNLAEIKVDTDLTELWSELWSSLEYNRAGPIYLPMYHMKSEGFWNLEYRTEQRPPQVGSTRAFERTVRSVSLDSDLMELLDDDEARNSLINSLLNGGYFSRDEIEKLKRKITEMISSFEYEEKLQEQIEKEFTMKTEPDGSILQPSRDPAFRRLILKSYAETCAVCGARLVTSNGISVIDSAESALRDLDSPNIVKLRTSTICRTSHHCQYAAHILPFARFGNDDVRNGMALCKTHHWLFDKGLISVDQHYRALVSKDIMAEGEPDGATGSLEEGRYAIT